MDRRIILPLVALLIVAALATSGAILGQTAAPPSNALPSPLVAGWQPVAGQVSYVATSDDIRGADPAETLATELLGIRASITESDLYQGEYQSDVTYSAMEIVSVGSGITSRYFIYSSPTERSTAHNPETAPQHWREIGRLTSMQPNPGGTPAHFAGGELVVIGTDVYLCLTEPPYAVDASGISVRPEFLRITTTTSDINSLIAVHNAAADTHTDIRGLIPRLHFRGEWDADTAYIFGDIISVGVSNNRIFFIAPVANTGVNPTTQNQTSWKPVTPEGEGAELAGPWAADGLYQLGSLGSLVTRSNRLFFYSSAVARDRDHDPLLFPQFWVDVSNTVGLVNMAENSSIRVPRGTLVLMTEDDAIFLATTDAGASSLRSAATIRANSGLGGDFVRLNPPPPATYREFVSGLTVDWREGMLSKFGTGWFISRADHTQAATQATPSSSRFDQLATFRRMTQAAYTALTPKDSSTFYITGDSGVVRLYLGTIKVAGP